MYKYGKVKWVIHSSSVEKRYASLPQPKKKVLETSEGRIEIENVEREGNLSKKALLF